ncbi:MAG: TetR/AcrR family transcriptional regulator [Muribaculaceae bacterium]|nr:TetR/AcrR family transcriptional regulator [Muribaculaceae bacterium]
MERSDLTSEQYASLLEAIFPIIGERGPSHTSMDHVASKLGMSKRTLYEIFENKDDMLKEVLAHHHDLHEKEMAKLFENSPNVMVGLYKSMLYQQQFFSKINPVFFRDMDERFKHIRPEYDKNNDKGYHAMAKVIRTGVEQGVLRPDFDFRLQFTLLKVQMESLKRMEEYFPPDVTLSQAYSAISEGFLRSIATSKGLEIIESMELSKQDTDKI